MQRKICALILIIIVFGKKKKCCSQIFNICEMFL